MTRLWRIVATLSFALLCVGFVYVSTKLLVAIFGSDHGDWIEFNASVGAFAVFASLYLAYEFICFTREYLATVVRARRDRSDRPTDPEAPG